MRALTFLVCLFLVPTAFAGDSRAIGYYSKGRLTSSVNFAASPAQNFVLLFPQRKRTYATAEMVDLLNQLAARVRADGRERLQLGDLAAQSGGLVEGHGSHQNGLDADVVYLTRNGVEQKPGSDYWSEWFVRDGKISANFDRARNWEIIKWLARHKLVQRVFVDGAIKRALCAEARQRGEQEREKNTLRLLSPENTVHKTHFHLRLACPPGHPACVPQPPPSDGNGCG